MSDLKDLNKAVTELLGILGQSAQVTLRRNAPDAAYEAYIFTLILKAFSDLGANVALRSPGTPGKTPAVFVVRGAPGAIYSSIADFGYATVQYSHHELEVHIDVTQHGTSEVLHEIDVAVIAADECRQSRMSRGHPRGRHTHLAIECKFYNTPLPIHLIRTFVGLTDDLGTLRINRFVSNTRSPSILRYCTGKRSRPRFTADLTPLNVDIERQFVDSLVDDLRHWLG